MVETSNITKRLSKICDDLHIEAHRLKEVDPRMSLMFKAMATQSEMLVALADEIEELQTERR